MAKYAWPAPELYGNTIRCVSAFASRQLSRPAGGPSSYHPNFVGTTARALAVVQQVTREFLHKKEAVGGIEALETDLSKKKNSTRTKKCSNPLDASTSNTPTLLEKQDQSVELPMLPKWHKTKRIVTKKKPLWSPNHHFVWPERTVKRKQRRTIRWKPKTVRFKCCLFNFIYLLL